MVALALLGTSATILFSWSLAFLVSQIFIEHASVSSVSFCFIFIAAGGLVKALVIWLQELLATRASSSVKLELRHKFYASLTKLGPSWLSKQSIAEVNVLATVGLDALDPYFAKFLPQLVYTALVTPIFIVVIWMNDLASGITLLVTLPLIPIFMILIGWATGAVQQRQLDSLELLSKHFLEVLRGLTTLKIFNRVSAQTETMTQVSRQYRERTMKVLRVTFLSGFALELIASLSVALIAVSIGLRLMSGDLTLMVGLFVLLLAPEAFLPIRQVGAQFHASSEGVTSAKRVLDVIDGSASLESNSPSKSFSRYEFLPGELTVLTGPSGIGKSTIFRDLLGFSGQAAILPHDQCAWLPQSTSLFSGSVSENIAGSASLANSERLGLSMALAALDDLPPDYEVGVDGARVSGGQAQRICLARAFYRLIDSGCQFLLLDEPISALDSTRAGKVIETLHAFAKEGKTVVAITHQIGLIKAADRVIEVGNV